MQRMGEVTAIHGDLLEITFCRPSDCEKCNACHGGQQITTILVPGQARLGDGAVVEMPTGTVVQASALAYGLPLAGLLAGAVAGALLFPAHADAAGGAGGLIGLGLMLLLVRVTERQRKNDPRWKPQLVEIIPQSNQ